MLHVDPASLVPAPLRRAAAARRHVERVAAAYGQPVSALSGPSRQRALALMTAAPVAVPAIEKPPTVEAARPTPRAAVQPVADPVTLFFRGLFALFGARPQSQGA